MKSCYDTYCLAILEGCGSRWSFFKKNSNLKNEGKFVLVIGTSRKLRKTITDWLDFAIKNSLSVFVMGIMSNCMITRGFYSQFVR